VNAAYGTKLQVGVLLGLSQNLGTADMLALRKGGKYTAYGYGYYDTTQQIVDHLYRVVPQVSYNLPNVRFGLEYDFTTASYGNVQSDGTAVNLYSVNNHRILASVMYIF
jgi:hypothetical protein